MYVHFEQVIVKGVSGINGLSDIPPFMAVHPKNLARAWVFCMDRVCRSYS